MLSALRKLTGNLLVWAIAEIVLTLVGLDTMADYSEFLVAREDLKMFSAAGAIAAVIVPRGSVSLATLWPAAQSWSL
jgi:hypothetical protein